VINEQPLHAYVWRSGSIALCILNLGIVVTQINTFLTELKMRSPFFFANSLAFFAVAPFISVNGFLRIYGNELSVDNSCN
jgi:hypothetical protein